MEQYQKERIDRNIDQLVKHTRWREVARVLSFQGISVDLQQGKIGADDDVAARRFYEAMKGKRDSFEKLLEALAVMEQNEAVAMLDFDFWKRAAEPRAIVGVVNWFNPRMAVKLKIGDDWEVSKYQALSDVPVGPGEEHDIIRIYSGGKTTYFCTGRPPFAKAVKNEQAIKAVVYDGRWRGRHIGVKLFCRCDVLSKVKLKEEVLSLKRLRHPHVVQYFGCGFNMDYVFIAMELCKCSLTDLYVPYPTQVRYGKHIIWMTTAESIVPDGVVIYPVEVLRQMTSGLEFLHDNNVVHGGLKSGNVLLRFTMRKKIVVKLGDYGLRSKVLLEREWIAPEILDQWEGNVGAQNYIFSFKSDIFSLGILYYFVLTKGEHPFGDYNRMITNMPSCKPEMEEKALEACFPGSVALIKSMLDKNPDNRPELSDIMLNRMFKESNTESIKNFQAEKLKVHVSNSDLKVGIDVSIPAILEGMLKSRHRFYSTRWNEAILAEKWLDLAQKLNVSVSSIQQLQLNSIPEDITVCNTITWILLSWIGVARNKATIKALIAALDDIDGTENIALDLKYNLKVQTCEANMEFEDNAPSRVTERSEPMEISQEYDLKESLSIKLNNNNADKTEEQISQPQSALQPNKKYVQVAPNYNILAAGSNFNRVVVPYWKIFGEKDITLLEKDNKWKKLGEYLGISKSSFAEYQKEMDTPVTDPDQFPITLKMIITKMLMDWYRNKREEATIGRLIVALRCIEGLESLADDLMNLNRH